LEPPRISAPDIPRETVQPFCSRLRSQHLSARHLEVRPGLQLPGAILVAETSGHDLQAGHQAIEGEGQCAGRESHQTLWCSGSNGASARWGSLLRSPGSLYNLLFK
jgi:hypothetical protein